MFGRDDRVAQKATRRSIFSYLPQQVSDPGESWLFSFSAIAGFFGLALAAVVWCVFRPLGMNSYELYYGGLFVAIVTLVPDGYWLWKWRTRPYSGDPNRASGSDDYNRREW